MIHAFKQYVLNEGAKISDKTQFEIIALIDTTANEDYLLNPADVANIDKAIEDAISTSEPNAFAKRYQFILTWTSLHRITNKSSYKALVLSATELGKHLKKDLSSK